MANGRYGWERGKGPEHLSEVSEDSDLEHSQIEVSVADNPDSECSNGKHFQTPGILHIMIDHQTLKVC